MAWLAHLRLTLKSTDTEQHRVLILKKVKVNKRLKLLENFTRSRFLEEKSEIQPEMEDFDYGTLLVDLWFTEQTRMKNLSLS